MEVMAEACGISLEGYEHILKLIMVMTAHT